MCGGDTHRNVQSRRADKPVETQATKSVPEQPVKKTTLRDKLGRFLRRR